MADIELVIKIDEEEYINIKNAINSLIENGVERASMSKLCLAILDGTPLPKGHGRLIDADDIRVIELEDSLYILRHEKGDEIDFYIDAPTIIEADVPKKRKGTPLEENDSGYNCENWIP